MASNVRLMRGLPLLFHRLIGRPDRAFAPHRKGPSATAGVCLITMARDEPVMLRHWVAHYQRLLDRPRFVVLDDASDPRMEAGLRAAAPDADIDVIRLPDGPFSDAYKSDTLSAMAAIMLTRFAIVIASDADEVVAPLGPARAEDFFSLLRRQPRPFAAPIGLSPVHRIGAEPAFDPDAPLGAQRAVGELRANSTKPVIWQGAAGRFRPGQHRLEEGPQPVTRDLALVHLKHVDADLFHQRMRDRDARRYCRTHAAHFARHWRVPTAPLASVPPFAGADGYLAAPPLEDAIEPFLQAACRRTRGGTVELRDLSYAAPVRFAGWL